jgi:hypothetical protein
MLKGYLASFWTKGSPNAAVLPLPVSAFAITLYPFNIERMVKDCIGVGVIYWIL